MTGRKYRVWFHYNKYSGGMTAHHRGKCKLVKDIDCQVATETHWNKSQPHLVLRGFAYSVDIDNNKATIR